MTERCGHGLPWSVDCIECETVWIERVTTPETLKGIRQLMKFYGVDRVLGLVHEQANHIVKLQSQITPIRDDQPRKVREG